MNYDAFSRYLGRWVESNTTSDDSAKYYDWNKKWNMNDVYEALTTVMESRDSDPYEYYYVTDGGEKIRDYSFVPSKPKKRNPKNLVETELIDDAEMLDEFLDSFAVNK